MRKTATVLLVMAAAILVFAAVNLYGQVFDTPHEPGSTYFPDVTVGIPGDEHIGYLYESEVTGGFPDGSYRPDDYVTREQMAIYLTRQRAVSFVDCLLAIDLWYGELNRFGPMSPVLTYEEAMENFDRHYAIFDQTLAMEGEVTLPHGM